MQLEVIGAGVLASLIASFAFWGYFLLLRPKLKVASVISQQKEVDSDGNIYLIKFVNKGLCAVTDVHCELAIAREEHVGNGRMKQLRREVIPIRNCGFKYLPGQRLRHKFGVKQAWVPNAKCIVFDDAAFGEGRTLEGTVGHQGFFLELSVFARHSVSGHGGQVYARYMNATAVKAKNYKPGATLDLEGGE